MEQLAALPSGGEDVVEIELHGLICRIDAEIEG